MSEDQEITYYFPNHLTVCFHSLEIYNEHKKRGVNFESAWKDDDGLITAVGLVSGPDGYWDGLYDHYIKKKGFFVVN